jgi:hypothetical protein
MLRLKVLVRPDTSLEVSGVFGEGLLVSMGGGKPPPFRAGMIAARHRDFADEKVALLPYAYSMRLAYRYRLYHNMARSI